MNRHFHTELEKLKKMILALGAMVEDRVYQATLAIETMDIGISQRIIISDQDIDDREVEIEEECLKILALYQPVAVDLRFIVAVIKINNDLERIGDQAVNIAERVATMSKQDRCDFFFDYSNMAKKAQFMLKQSLDALVNLDIDLALEVVTLDDSVDNIKRDAYDRIKAAMADHPHQIGYLINLLLVSRHIERLADHATNIAEEVIYLVEGEIVRHKGAIQGGVK